jgi:hypothetical protein
MEKGMTGSESVMRFGKHPHVSLLAVCVGAHAFATPSGHRQRNIPCRQPHCHEPLLDVANVSKLTGANRTPRSIALASMTTRFVSGAASWAAVQGSGTFNALQIFRARLFGISGCRGTASMCPV